MNIGDRMKKYESVSRNRLTARTPVIIRVDGRAFHTFTKGMDRPFDRGMIESMVAAAVSVADEMHGFKCAYIQSDEASFLITDYDRIASQGWFDYNLSKMVSISASVMSVHFSMIYSRPAFFDSRAFNVPENDVSNYFLWRARDWSRNSLQMYARAHFSHKELYKKGREDIHNMLHGIGKNWTNDLLSDEKNGTFLLLRDGEFLSETSITPDFASVDKVIKKALESDESGG